MTTRGDGDPAGINSLHGDGDGKKMPPARVDGDGDGEILPQRGRGWVANTRRGIPHGHP